MSARAGRGRRTTWPAVGLALVLLGACTAPAPEPTPSLVRPTASSSPSAAPTAAPTATVTPDPAAAFPAPPAVGPATAEPTDVLTGLAAPWDVDFLPGGAVLVTLRDAAQVLLVTEAGAVPLTGPGGEDLASGTATRGEGGLLGVAVPPDVAGDGLIYLYRTTPSGNQVVRGVLDAGAATLGPLEQVVGGIPAAGNHNGGRIAFGPDGHLYVATGDAGDRPSAQDPSSLAGKILRVTPDGAPAPGNPTPGSPVWSLGHRNVQGLAWTDDGRLVASEFGQDTFDELNVIEPGADYGWPTVEGDGGAAQGFVDPIRTWAPSEASPSGVAVADGVAYVAGLRGRRVWAVPVDDPGAAAPFLEGVGRVREVAVGPDGALWVLTNNTDGRGDPRPGDDRLLRVALP